MKKLGLLVAVFVFSLQTALADLNIGLRPRVAGPIANGFYVNAGFGLQSFGGRVNLGNVSGVNLSLEAGHHFNVFKISRFGIGFDISWAQVGFSVYNNFYNNFYLNSNTTQWDFHFLKSGPSVQFKITDKLAADGFFLFNPTLIASFVSSNGFISNAASFGLLFTPGVRLRYSMFFVGFDYSFGNMLLYNSFTNMNLARVTAGLKF